MDTLKGCNQAWPSSSKQAQKQGEQNNEPRPTELADSREQSGNLSSHHALFSLVDPVCLWIEDTGVEVGSCSISVLTGSNRSASTLEEIDSQLILAVPKSGTTPLTVHVGKHHITL